MKKKNKILAFSIILCMLFSMAVVPVSSASNIKIVVDGAEVYSDQPPIIRNDRVFVPVRVIAENLGANVNFKEDYGQQQVYISDENHTSEFTIDSAFCTIDGLALAMDTKPFIENSRTLLPVRIVAQALDCIVSWDNETRTVNIQKSKYDESMYNDLKIYSDKPLVYTAIFDEIKYPYNSYINTYTVPALNINQEGAKALSEKINILYQKYLEDNNGSYTVFEECHYAYYLYDGVLSVIFYSFFSDWDVYDVFNYDIESGKELTNEDIFSLYNIDTNQLVSNVKNNCLAHIEIEYSSWNEYYIHLRNYVLNNSVFDLSKPIFIDNNGFIHAAISAFGDAPDGYTIDSGINISHK